MNSLIAFAFSVVFFAAGPACAAPPAGGGALFEKSAGGAAKASGLRRGFAPLAVLKKRPSNRPPFEAVLIAEGLGVPWGMAFIDSDTLLWTEREGRLKILKNGRIKTVQNLPPQAAEGQGGLLDIALHPDFSSRRLIYWTYAGRPRKQQEFAQSASARAVHPAFAASLLRFFPKPRRQRGMTTFLARGELHGANGASPHLKNAEILFAARPLSSAGRHFGSRIVFDDKGFLFITVGDRGRKQEAQNLRSHFGKLLRLKEDGSFPSDNPFAGGADASAEKPPEGKNPPAGEKPPERGARGGFFPEIWTYGHRNPQGLFLDRESGRLFLQEHGPKGGDEINVIQKGLNYGWPVVTHGRSYAGFKIGEGAEKPGMEAPLKHWTPSIAPSGLLVYSGKAFPEWKGDLFSGALVGRHLNRLKIEKNRKGGRAVSREERLLSDLNMRVRHVIEGPDGLIYLSADRGWIVRLQPL